MRKTSTSTSEIDRYYNLSYAKLESACLGIRKASRRIWEKRKEDFDWKPQSARLGEGTGKLNGGPYTCKIQLVPG